MSHLLAVRSSGSVQIEISEGFVRFCWRFLADHYLSRVNWTIIVTKVDVCVSQMLLQPVLPSPIRHLNITQ